LGFILARYLHKYKIGQHISSKMCIAKSTNSQTSSQAIGV
jgi:hypothetical protein